MFAEGANSSFAIPEQGDNFGEMSGLSSLSGTGPSGGLGGSGSGHGAGKGRENGRQSEADSMDLYSSPETRSDLDRDSLARKIPTLGDVPVMGKLFSDRSDKQKELQVPKITTRSVGDDFDGVINYGSPIVAEAGKADAPVTNGNRSGDFGNTRNSIDAVLSNPNQQTEGLKEAESLRKVGKYAEAREALEKTLAANPGDARVVQELKQLGDPIRSNPALTYEHTQEVDDVRRSLYKAEGNLNLGKYDVAKKEYENTLRSDPYNQAARRGLEKVAAAKSDYYRAAYDHTRSELLSQVDNAWELSVPADQAGEKANAEVDREFKYPTEYEPPTLSSQTAAGGKAVPVTPESPTSLMSDAKAGQSEPAKEDADLEVSKVTESGKRSSGVEYELHTGYSSQYLFGGMDLGDSDSLRKAIRDQEDKVEERRKVLATIANTKGIIYKGADGDKGASGAHEEAAIKRGLDAQDYVDAKRDFEKDQVLLQQLKLKLESSEKAPEPEQPKIDLTKLMEEVSASEDPYSTFSLNISDASFKVAQAALAKGERPDPAGIKVEQFYNAVDYGDPSPQNGQPVAVNIEQSAHPVIPGRNLVRVALKTAAAGRSAAQPLRLTLLVDQSGSMVRADRHAAMDKALASLSGLLTKNDQITVIGFARTPRLLAGGMTGDQAGKLKDLVNQAANEGGTNLELAMNLAAKKAMEYKMPGAQNRIVLFTDGAANLGDADPARLAEKVKFLRQSGIAFDIAGIAADELNDDLLGELARNGNGRYYVVGKGGDQDLGKQLAGAFRPAAENVKVQVHFNPERVSRYKLIGFEKDRLKTEDFRNDAVDAAELAAEEAGVAIYQVETLPGGSGEIGEVSVRFRDTAAGQMVERTWAIPHDSKAPAIDRATPSMQLAVLSMLAAEKLKGGPLGAAIDFKQLVDTRANVKRFYGNTGRSAEMLQVIDAIK